MVIVGNDLGKDCLLEQSSTNEEISEARRDIADRYLGQQLPDALTDIWSFGILCFWVSCRSSKPVNML
jgi:hypothetical protein